jgi:uncharacterized protein YqeY
MLYNKPMEIQKKVEEALKRAMKEKNADALAVFRLLKSAMDYKSIELKRELTDDDMIALIKSEVKKRNESIEAFTAGNRPELAEKEKNEMPFLMQFLPEQMSEESVREIVKTAVEAMPEEDRKNFGKVMGVAMKELKGKADGGVVGQIVKELVS